MVPGTHRFTDKLVVVALVGRAVEVVGKRPKPAAHIGPGEKHGDRDRMIGQIVRMPAVNRDRIAGFAVVVREHGRVLLQNHVSGKFVPLVVVPGLRIQGRVFPCSYGIVPSPASQLSVFGMIGHQDPRRSRGITLRLLEHCKFIHIDGFVFVNAGLDMPAGEVSAIGAGEGACAHTANRRSLPIAIVD